MTKHLQRNLDALKEQMLNMGCLVEAQIENSIQSLIKRRLDLAEAVFEDDMLIDEREVSIEEDCLKILALHQPVATDLRYVITALKVNNDLERMGDLAVNVAERATYLSRKAPLCLDLAFAAMTQAVQKMVKSSLQALVNYDAALARIVIAADDEVDDMNRQNILDLQNLMLLDSTTIKRACHAFSISKHLERIADLATNIAEDVIFLVEGEVIRHKYESYRD